MNPQTMFPAIPRRETNTEPSLSAPRWCWGTLAVFTFVAIIPFGSTAYSQENSSDSQAGDRQAALQQSSTQSTPTGPQQEVARVDLPAAQPQRDYRYWKTNWSFDDIDIGNVLRRFRQVGIEIPLQADGDVTVNFSVSVPLNALRTGRAYKFSGRLTSNQLQLEQLRLTNLTTQINYQDGQLRFSNLAMRWLDGRTPEPTSSDPSLRALPNNPAAGRLTGDGAFQLVPLGNFAANLQAQSLSIAPVFDLVQELTDQTGNDLLAGSLTGAISAQGPLSSFGDIASWSVNANLRGSDLTFGDSPPLTVATGPLTLNQSRIVANDIRLGSPVDDSIRLAATIDATLKDELPFRFDLRGNDVPLPTIASIASLETSVPIEGKLDVDLTGSGVLAPENGTAAWNINGRLASPSLTIYGLRLGLIEHSLQFNAERFQLSSLRDQPLPGMLIQQIAANYQLDPEVIQLQEIDAQIFDGTLTGEAAIARDEEGVHRIGLNWQELRPQMATQSFVPASAQLSLRTSGSVEWQVPSETLSDLETHRGAATIVINPISINNSTIGDLQASIQVGEGELAIAGSGNLFGGTFQVDTVAPLANLSTNSDVITTSKPDDQNRTDISFTRINVRGIQSIFAPETQAVSGLLSGTGTLSNSSPLQLNARLTGNNFRLGSVPIASRFDSSFSLEDRQLQINWLRGNYARGRCDVVGRVNLAEITGQLTARLEAIDFARGALPISPALSNLVGGRLSSRVTVNLRNEIDIRGAVKVRDNEIFQIATGSTHGNLRISLAKDLSAWSVDLRNLQGTVGRGQIDGDLQLASSTTRRGAFDMESQWQAKRLDFTSLLSDFGSQTKYARGELDGSLVLGGNSIQSVSDLRGRFDAKLGGTQARAVPGLLATQSYLGAFSMAGTTFEAGRARGNIGSGLIDLTEFWLVSDQVNVWADGRIRIPSGRLDIAAVVQTGDFEAQNVALLALAEAATLPAGIPIGTIVRLNRLASNRTLYFDVVGQLPKPRVRLRPFDVLRENAAEYLLRETAASFVPFSTSAAILPIDQND